MPHLWNIAQCAYRVFCTVVHVLFTPSLLQARRGKAVSQEAVEMIRGPFFTLTLNIVVIDLLQCLPKLYTTLRIWGVGYETLDRLTATIGLQQLAYTSIATLAYNHGFAVMLQTINRYTAMVMPLKYQKIWSAKTLRLTVGASWLAMLLVCAPLLHYAAGTWEYKVYNISGLNSHGECHYHYPKVMMLYYTIGLLESILCTIANTLLYTLIVRSIIKRRRRAATGRFRRNDSTKSSTSTNPKFTIDRAQLNMTLIGGILAGISVAMAAFTVAATYYSYQQTIGGADPLMSYAINVYLYPLANDLSNYSHPFLVLLCSSVARSQFFFTLGLRRKTDANLRSRYTKADTDGR